MNAAFKIRGGKIARVDNIATDRQNMNRLRAEATAHFETASRLLREYSEAADGARDGTSDDDPLGRIAILERREVEFSEYERKSAEAFAMQESIWAAEDAEWQRG